MSTTSQPSSVVEVQFVQQNVYIGVGIFSLVTSALCTFVIGYSKSIRLAQPFFLAISIGDLITSSAYVVSGVTRYVQLDNNYYFTLVKPSECLKQPLLHLYYLGVQFACLIGCLMAVERLVSVSVPDWFKTNWTPPVTRWLIVLIAGYTTVSVGLGYVAILSFNATGATLQAKCSLTVVGGPVYTAYFYSLCVGSTSLAQVLAIAAFVIGLFR